MFRLEIRLSDHAPAHRHAVCLEGKIKLTNAFVLSQIPTLRDIVGILLVMVGVAVHKPAAQVPE